MCDEQHRFGVAQRSALGEKGAGADMLVMSATPIPRTLSLIFYGDLDISEIKDKPKARAEIVTGIVPPRKYDDMLEYIGEQAKLGNQSYFVCPKIEGDEEGSLISVTELFDELKNRLPRVRFALLHGKMKDKEKTEIMQAFKDKKYDCLVSTTVIEVGVDVPDATIMVIYNAERFGLSQLHQLRGRVGRGSKKSYCFLLMGSDSPAGARAAVRHQKQHGRVQNCRIRPENAGRRRFYGHAPERQNAVRTEKSAISSQSDLCRKTACGRGGGLRGHFPVARTRPQKIRKSARRCAELMKSAQESTSKRFFCAFSLTESALPC